MVYCLIMRVQEEVKLLFQKKLLGQFHKIYNTGEGCLYLGSLDSKRDWGSAKDYVECGSG